MVWWYELDPKYDDLIIGVKKLFISNDMTVPNRILPLSTLPTDNVLEIFKQRLETIAFLNCCNLNDIIYKTERQRQLNIYWKGILEGLRDGTRKFD